MKKKRTQSRLYKDGAGRNFCINLLYFFQNILPICPVLKSPKIYVNKFNWNSDLTIFWVLLPAGEERDKAAASAVLRRILHQSRVGQAKTIWKLENENPGKPCPNPGPNIFLELPSQFGLVVWAMFGWCGLPAACRAGGAGDRRAQSYKWYR